MAFKTWDELKKEGSSHYKDGEAQLIDIYRQKGTFKPWAVNEVTQHVQRNSPVTRDCYFQDLIKSKHYIELLMAEYIEKTTEKTFGVDE